MTVVTEIVRRSLSRSPGRAALTALLTMALTAIATSGFVFMSALTPSAEQVQGSTLLGADLQLSYGLATDDEAALTARRENARAVLVDRYGADVRVSDGVQAVDVDVRAVDASGASSARSVAATVWEWDAGVLDTDKGYRLVAGDFPTTSCTAAVSSELAREQGVAVGDSLSIALASRPVRVVGLFQPRLSHASRSVIVGPGTWAECVADGPGVDSATAFATGWVFIPPASHARLEEDLVPREGDEVMPISEYLGEDVSISAVGTDDDGWDPFWVRRPTDFTIPILALMALAVTAQVAVRMRRDAHLMGSLQALGFRSVQVVAVVVLNALLPISGGAIIGFGLGLGAAVPTQSALASLAGRDPPTSPLPIGAIAWAVAVFVVVCAVGVACSAFLFARKEGLAASSVHFVERAPAPRGTRVARIIFICLLGAVVASWVLLPTNDIYGLVRGALTCAALIAAVPLVDAWLVQRSRPDSPVRWLGARIARAQPGRMITVSAAVAVGLATPLAMLMLQSTYAAEAAAAYRPSFPDGQVVVLLQNPMDHAALQSLVAAAGIDPVVQPRAATAEGNDVFAVPGGSVNGGSAQAEVTVVDDRRDAAVILGWEMPDAAWETISNGAALWIFDKSMPTQVKFVSYDAAGAMHTLGTLDASGLGKTVPSTATHNGGVVVSRASVARLGLRADPFWVRFPEATDKYDRIVEAAAQVGIAGSDVRREEGPFVSTPPVSYSVALAMALVLVGAVVYIVIATAGREDRRTSGILLALGADTGRVRQVRLYVSGLALLAGAVVGLVSAFAIFVAEFVHAGVERLAMPWTEAAGTVAAVLAVGAVAAGVGVLTQSPRSE